MARSVSRERLNSGMARSVSRERLNSLLLMSDAPTTTTNLCEDCITRVSSHASLATLAEAEEGEDEGEEEGGAWRGEADADPHRRCKNAACHLCAAEKTSWRRELWRALSGTAVAATTYGFWLRYVASEETARRQISAIVRGIGSTLFRYKVVGGQTIPKEGAAMVVVRATPAPPRPRPCRTVSNSLGSDARTFDRSILAWWRQ